MDDGVKETLFVRVVLIFMLLADKFSNTKISKCGENQGAKVLAKHPLSSSNSKRIDVCYHFLRHLANGDIRVAYVPIKEQHADILTYLLNKEGFEGHYYI